MGYFVKEKDDVEEVYRSKEIEPKNLNIFGSELALKIIKELSKKPSCAMDIARSLGEHEQKIYYHLRKFEKAGIISLFKREVRVGALTKIYKLESPYISVKIYDEEPLTFDFKVKDLKVLHPFVYKGRMNSIIVVSSPDPHGRFGAQSSDGYAAIDLALYIGSFIKKPTINYKLDTQVKEEELKENLILVGGPKANIIVDKINKYLPIYFDEKNEWQIVSTISKNVYRDDDVGIVTKIKNPFNKNNFVFLFCGKRFKGTRAATLALIKHAGELKGEEFYRVVKGIDKDADSIIDDVIFLE